MDKTVTGKVSNIRRKKWGYDWMGATILQFCKFKTHEDTQFFNFNITVML